MSRLLISDNGRVLRDHNEDLTRWRWARKTFDLSKASASADADLWVLASSYKGSRAPLAVMVNGKPAGVLKPRDDDGLFTWNRLGVPARLLNPGINQVTFECDVPAMNAWRLALDNTASVDGAPSHSAASFDRGQSWRTDHLGAYNVLRGEYVVRLRTHGKGETDDAPSAIVYSDPKHPRLNDLRSVLPKAVTSQRDPWKQVLALRSWVATRWSHDPFGAAYCPWDALTILDWSKARRGHGGKGVVAMCVHFGVTFASLATALGHRARCCAITSGINDPTGHFVAEVFDNELGKWVSHDANFDTHFEDGQPLSVVEVAQRSVSGDQHIARIVRAGKGVPTGPERIMRLFRRDFCTGASYRLVSAWRRMDFVTDPTRAATHHGSIAYHEPDWVWYAAPGGDDRAVQSGVDRDGELGMFPQVTSDADWFAA